MARRPEHAHADAPEDASSGYALALHGGAGTLRRDSIDVAQAARFHGGLRRALAAGRAILGEGGRALDAVTAAVVALEDDPLFNAGHGAVYTSAGTHEMDAAVMDGRDCRAGAIAGICGPRNPILAARAVMEHSPHILLAGEGALVFCRSQHLVMVDAEYFHTSTRWQALQETLARQASGLAEDDEARRHGTVGAVARDRNGDVAAATSTGGTTGKLPGRIGDSPLIGAGTYADNSSCAVSATGHGEFFIRFAVAHEIAARVRLCGEPLASAARGVVEDLGHLGGSGGVVAVGRDGSLALPFNCTGMYRGYVKSDGIPYTAIYDEAYQTA
ncbi:MAG: isoaspartyl peptidase/L-asparaginase [Alphaproteobacteria bacterium]|nr:isoaspartyl peptidase/L-asparaginase [Alphaproteobacteria bacterium]